MVNQTLTRRPEGWIVAIISLLLFTAMLVVAAPPAAAADEGEVSFEGSGWGHGVGMSQFGAYAMAVEGATFTEILGHYYTSAGTGTLGQGGLDAADPIWVNLELDVDTLLLRVDAIPTGGEGAPVTITRGDDEWQAPVGSTIEIFGPDNCSMTVQPPGGVEPVEADPGDCSFDLWWYDFLSDDDPTTKIAIPGCTNTDWNVVPSEKKECKYGRGMLHVRSGAGGLDLSAEMTLDDYVLGISEMPYYWGDTGGIEALKAQAVAARSYARELQIYRSDLATNSCAAWCHVRDTTFDQRYVGWGHGQSNWITAANATAGVVVTHPDAPNNTVVRAYYSSSSGGRTESIQEVWTGWDARAYYQGVDDSGAVDGTVFNPNASWTVDVDNTTVAAAVGLAEVTSASVIERHSSGSAKTVSFSDGATTVSKSAAWVKSTFGLKSIYFDIELLAGSVPPSPTPPPPPAPTPPPPAPRPSFTDIAGSVHAEAIIDIAVRGVTKGCNPPANDRYCPDGVITRGQMAAFLTRAFSFPATSTDFFADDNTSIFQSDINRMAAAGVTSGCGGGNYCPNQQVSRVQMAAFLDRAFDFPDVSTDYFTDDEGSPFEASINRIAAAGITLGCNPPANDLFCPDALVTRAQMASFIDRALDDAGL